MKLKFLFLISVCFLNSIEAQDDTSSESQKNHWTKGGTFNFLINQSSFDNWTAGGVSNISGTLRVNYDFNYQKADWSWDNKLITAFGLTKIKDQNIQKSDDQLEFNSVLGKKASKLWYYSAFLNFKTQFTDDLDSETEGPTTFLSPAFLQFGPGMLWKKSDQLKVNIAPGTIRFIFVDKALTKPDAAYFGVEEGKSSRFEFGGALGAYYKFNLMPNVSVENILTLYSNYMEDPQNVDIDYSMNLVMKVNKFLSTNLSYQSIYDDNAFEGLQTRQVFGIGINFLF